MNRKADPLSDVLTEMCAKALVTWMTHSAQQGMPREELLIRGNDFVYAPTPILFCSMRSYQKRWRIFSNRVLNSKKAWTFWRSVYNPSGQRPKIWPPG